jgi:hypothetical protein
MITLPKLKPEALKIIEQYMSAHFGQTSKRTDQIKFEDSSWATDFPAAHQLALSKTTRRYRNGYGVIASQILEAIAEILQVKLVIILPSSRPEAIKLIQAHMSSVVHLPEEGRNIEIKFENSDECTDFSTAAAKAFEISTLRLFNSYGVSADDITDAAAQILQVKWVS